MRQVHPMGRRTLGVCLLIALAVVLTGMAGLMAGAYPLSPSEVWAVLRHASQDAMAQSVIHDLRLPRAMGGLFCGALLAVSGAVLQGLTRNPLADPTLIGVSQGAALAVVAMITLMPGAALELRQLAAFGGALAAAALVQAVAGQGRGGGPLKLILSGIGLSAFLAALTAALLTHGALRDAQTALGWMSGSLNALAWPEVASAGWSCAVLVPLALGLCRPLAALQLGEEVARSLGLRVGLMRPLALGVAVAAAAVATAAVGPLSYIGLIAPHLAHRLARASLAGHLVLSALLGGLLVMLADLVGRLAFAPLQIPAGLVTAMIGVPVLLALILRRPAA